MGATGRLGIIGGSGLYDLPDLQVLDRPTVETPFGSPSDRLTIGRLGETEMVFLPRHGAGHRLTPTELPYRANIYALKQLGVTHLLTVSAVGSLKEALPPRTIVLPDQIIDRTVSRARTFFEDGAVAHVGIAHPYCELFGSAIIRIATAAGVPIVQGGTYVSIEGPQFSTRAESMLYRSWDASVIGMTAMPEARLAREAELCYATLAMVTDYDVWHESEAHVSVELVSGHLHANAAMAQNLLRQIATSGLPDRTCACGDALRHAIVTDRSMITAATRRRLGVIAERYLGDSAE